jgi:hypothetical protein
MCLAWLRAEVPPPDPNLVLSTRAPAQASMPFVSATACCISEPPDRGNAEEDRRCSPLVLDCASCGRRVHWVSGLGVTLGRWAHREPAPHHTPVV